MSDGRTPWQAAGVGGRSWYGSICDKRVCGTKRQAKGNKWSQRTTPCFVMLLSVDGSHGLDLSFVTHIFLLDKVGGQEEDGSTITYTALLSNLLLSLDLEPFARAAGGGACISNEDRA